MNISMYIDIYNCLSAASSWDSLDLLYFLFTSASISEHYNCCRSTAITPE